MTKDIHDVGGAEAQAPRYGHELEALYDIPVTVSAVLGRTVMPISQLLKLGRGAVVQLDRMVGDSIEVHVNNKLIARGELVLLDGNKIGITMSEIARLDRLGLGER